MGRVECCYFISTLVTVVFSSLVVVTYVYLSMPIYHLVEPPCNANHIEQAVLEGSYTDVCNEASPEKSFKINNVSYVCPCSTNPCISKCCPWGKEGLECSKPSDEKEQKAFFYNLQYYSSTRDRTPKANKNSHFNIVFFNYRLKKDKNLTVYGSDPSNFYLFQNGTVKPKEGCIENNCDMYRSSYCFDTIFNEAEKKLEFRLFFGINLLHYSNQQQNDASTSSVSEQNEGTFDEIESDINVSVCLVSGGFFMLTFVIYASIPKLRNDSGKCLMCYFLSMSVTNVWLACQNFGTDDVSEAFCAVMAFSTQFSFLCSFFWVHVVNFDLWLKLSGRYQRMLPTSSLRSVRCTTRFMMYSIYAWGCPALIVGATLLVEYHPHTFNDKYLALGLESLSCWFSTDNVYAFYIYYYVPLGVLVCHNILLFILTVRNINTTMKSKLRKSSRKSKQFQADRKRFYLCLKLIPVTGMYWICELVTVHLDLNTSTGSITNFILNFLICSEGIIVFIIFVCKRDVLGLLSHMFCPSVQRKFFAANSSYYESSKSNDMEPRSLRRCSLDSSTTDTNLDEFVQMSPC